MDEVQKSRMPDNEAACTMYGDFIASAMERGISLFKDDIAGDKCRHAGKELIVE